MVQSFKEEAQVIDFTNSILASEGYPDDYLNLLPRYYSNSVLFVVYHKDKLIGALRLFEATKPCRILDFWNVTFPNDIPISEYREMGSLVIDERYRGKSRWAMTALLDISYKYSKQNGVNWWFASAYHSKFQKFKMMNPSCKIMEISEPNEHQLKYRETYSDFFDKAKTAVIFVFNLEGVSYSHQFKRILRKKLKSTSTPYPTSSNSV